MAATAVTISREQVLAYRALAHGLGDADTDDVLGVGLQDNPPGRTANGAGGCGAAPRERRRPVQPELRAIRAEPGGRGVHLGDAMDGVATAMREVMADGIARTKGELSGAVTPLVDRRLTPWCEGCAVHHVHDALFRYSTQQAGLVIEVEWPTSFRFVAATDGGPWPPVNESRAELTRRFLHLAGPVQRAHLGSWLGLAPAGARRWWALLEDELVNVTIDTRTSWVHADDLDAITAAPGPPEVRLLPGYDPVTEIGDRELLVPDAGNRREVWKAVSNPGVLLRRGEIAGVWRQEASRGTLRIVVRPFGPLAAAGRRALDSDARTIASYNGASDVEIRIE